MIDTDALELELGPTASECEAEWKGQLTIAAGATIDPVAEGASIKLASGGGITCG